MKPTIGSIVHYKSRDGNDYAAIITRVLEGKRVTRVSLAAFNELGCGYRLAVSEGDGPNQWHWPEKV